MHPHVFCIIHDHHNCQSDHNPHNQNHHNSHSHHNHNRHLDHTQTKPLVFLSKHLLDSNVHLTWVTRMKDSRKVREIELEPIPLL